jgi:hypothetical protein
MNDYEWEQVCSLRFIGLSPQQIAQGCPDAFEPSQLAIMQRPTARRADQHQYARKIQDAIEAGTLPALERTRMVDETQERCIPDMRAWRSSFARRGLWGEPDVPPMKRIIEKVGEREVHFQFIGRAAFRDFLDKRGEPPSEHIRAWLRPLERDEGVHQGEAAAPAKPKRETQTDRVAHWLTECERRAADADKPFERSNMPGTKAEFLDLLHALDADLKSIKTVASLDRYLSATGCKWPLDASAQPSAAPLYARLFPKAHIRTPRVVSPQRRKA